MIITERAGEMLALDGYSAETCARHVLDCEEGRIVLMGYEGQ